MDWHFGGYGVLLVYIAGIYLSCQLGQYVGVCLYSGANLNMPSHQGHSQCITNTVLFVFRGCLRLFVTVVFAVTRRAVCSS
jgi:hypothetical protein